MALLSVIRPMGTFCLLRLRMAMSSPTSMAQVFDVQPMAVRRGTTCREGRSAGLYDKEETIIRTRRPTPVASDDDRILKITRRFVKYGPYWARLLTRRLGVRIHPPARPKCAGQPDAPRRAPNHGRSCVPPVCQLSHMGRNREILIGRTIPHKRLHRKHLGH